MSLRDPAMLTKAELTAAPGADRARLVEDYLLASIRALPREGTAEIDGSSHLADLAIDSLQVVELKFGLDQLLGQELDIELIISNPTVRELAAGSVQAAGLQ